MLFDHDGDELRTEVGELLASNGCVEAEFWVFQVVSYLKAARLEDLEDTPVIPGTGRRLPKRKLMYGRMVIDFESEYVAKRPRLRPLGMSKRRNPLCLHSLTPCPQVFELPQKPVRFLFWTKNPRSVTGLLMHALIC